MGQLKRDCPHCHTKNTAFQAFGEVLMPEARIYTVAFYCTGCYGGISAEIELMSGETPCRYPADIDSNPNLIVHKWFPQPKQKIAPKSLPENIEKFYLQAADSLQAQNYDAAAMMSRKTLEVAIKILSPDLSGSLYSRIEKLAENNLITPDLKDWAHIIREDGNIAAHEEEPVDPEAAEELLSFAEMFLMYTFTMPGLVREKRHDAEQEEI